MIYSLVHAPDIYSPKEFYRNPLYSSVLLSALKSWMRNCVILVDNENRITGSILSYLNDMPPQDRKNFKVCLEKLAKKNRIIRRDIDMLQGEDTENDFTVCQEIVRNHLPDAFIVAAKNSIALCDQAESCPGITVALCEYAASSLFDEIERHDFTIGTGNDYTVLKGVLKYARYIRLLDRNIGRYWGNDYRRSLEYLFDLYRDIGEFSKEGQFEIITGLVENKDEDKKKNQEKYSNLCIDFRGQVEKEYPFRITISVKKETSYKNLPHPRYLLTDQFLIQLDAGFKFFNVVTGKQRSNVLGVKEMNFQFAWDYEGLPDYTTTQGNFLMHQPFASLAQAENRSSVN
jgi:hypothetical protein